MIEKQKPITSSDSGRPFDMHAQTVEPRNDADRQRPIVIDLEDLNGTTNMPANFVRKAGRTLPSFDRYWTPDALADEQENADDIQ